MYVCLGLTAATLLTATQAQAEERRTYIHRAEDQDAPAARLLVDVDAALASNAAPTEVAFLLDRLLEEACTAAARDWVVEVAPDRWMGLRAWVLQCCRGQMVTAAATRAVPRPVVEALRDVQARGAAAAARAGRRRAEDVLARYPLAPEGAEAARALLSRAIACADLAEARAHLDTLSRLHGPSDDPGVRAATAIVRALEGDAPGAARALELLRALPAPADRAQRDALVAGTQAVVAAAGKRARPRPITVTDEQPATVWGALVPQSGDPFVEPCPVHAAALGGEGEPERVVVSSGTRLLVIDAATGAVVGRVPQALEAAAKAPEARARFAARPAGWAGVAYAPLVLERWLAPGREAEGDLAGRYYSLAAVDVAAGRLAWWDGDAGAPARGSPPGLDGAPAAVAAAARAGHVLAVAADARRVYVALLPKTREPRLVLQAYERAGGRDQALVLRAGWSAPVTLFSAERPAHVSQADEPVGPELAAALALDGSGRLLVTTDAGVAACVDALSGAIEWLVRPTAQRGGAARGFDRGAGAATPPEPARLASGREGPVAVLVVGDRLLCARLADGSATWSVTRGRTSRALVVDKRWVAAYGDQELLLHDLDSGVVRTRNAGFERDQRFCGEGAVVGRTLLLPSRLGSGVRLRRYDVQDGAGVALRTGPQWALPEHPLAANVTVCPRGLLVASGRAVTLARWER